MTTPPPIQVTATDAPDAEWDTQALSLGGNVFHSRAWGESCRALDGEVLYIRLARDGRTIGAAVASARRTRWRPLGWMRDVLHVNTPPALAAHVSRRDGLLALQGFAKRRGFAALEVASYADPRPSDESLPECWPTLVQRRLEFRVPLGPDGPATFARMHAGHRRNIRKARDAGFAFTEDTTLEGALALHALQEETFERRRGLGNDDATAWEREEYRRTMEAYVTRGLIRYFFAVRNGARLSGIGTLEFGSSAYYLVGGTSAEGYRSKAMFALFGWTIDRLIADGRTELNLGGVGIDVQHEGHVDHGLHRFKAGFGAQILTCRDIRTRFPRVFPRRPALLTRRSG